MVQRDRRQNRRGGKGGQGAGQRRGGGLSKSQASTIAMQTMDILDKGWYHAPSGVHVTVVDSVKAATDNTVLYTPEQIGAEFSARCKAHGIAARRERFRRLPAQTVIDVRAQTTIQALEMLWNEQETAVTVDKATPRGIIGALNFASAKNPGGGFINGARAQEESIARSSGLYTSLTAPGVQLYYRENKKESTCIYTDHVIFTPECPLFKDDFGVLREQPMLVSFISAPAVNAGVARKRMAYHDGPEEVIRDRMETRIRHVLDIAAENEIDQLVLGAFGCGVFRNDPAVVAAIFNNLLLREGYAECFSRVVFAIPGRVEDNLNAFLAHNWAVNN